MQDFKVLFVDDEWEVLSTVQEYLSMRGYTVTVTDSSLKALELIKEEEFEIVFTDLRMPGLSGLELLTAIKQQRPECDVIIVTGYGSVESAVEALKLGSYDYTQKPIKLERVKILIDRIVEKKKLQEENMLLRTKLKQGQRFDGLVGVSPKMQEIYEMIDRIKMSSPTILIQGESGTGKEVLAKVIHQNSDRKNNPFVPVNCGAIVEGLLESELFGHTKGSFTGASQDKIGLFEAARGGTLFLDEISRSSPSLQVKLLRVLQEKKIRPVGSSQEKDVDVRVIAATNRDPEEAVTKGIMRKDLFYRLNVVSIKLPPLRERKEDIPLLANHFIDKFNMTSNKEVSGISPDAMDMLLSYDWPGNVRQLENVIERAFALGMDGIIKRSDLPIEIRGHRAFSKSITSTYSLKENEIILIKKALEKTGGNKAASAKLLGINTATLYRKIKRYGIEGNLLQNAIS